VKTSLDWTLRRPRIEGQTRDGGKRSGDKVPALLHLPLDPGTGSRRSDIAMCPSLASNPVARSDLAALIQNAKIFGFPGDPVPKERPKEDEPAATT
jgi:hypothetical protein